MKKFLSSLTVCATALVCALSFTACGSENGSTGSGGNHIGGGR